MKSLLNVAYGRLMVILVGLCVLLDLVSICGNLALVVPELGSFSSFVILLPNSIGDGLRFCHKILHFFRYSIDFGSFC